MKNIQALGSGLGYRDKWFSDLVTNPTRQPDFLEITIDHFLDAPDWKTRELEELSENFILIPHGLDLSVGSVDGINLGYLEKIAQIIDTLKPPYWSEHLAFTKANGRELGHLAPLPFSHEAIETVAKNVEIVREYISTPLILENITYGLIMEGTEMDEATFINKVLEASHCGWLLDITNLYINSHNHSYDIAEFIAKAPIEKIIQVHYVGFSTNKDGKLIDDHAKEVNPEIYLLLEEILKVPNLKGAILERDENLPSFEDILEEVEKTRRLGQRFGKWG